jgi:hypothetical protein
MQNNLKHEKPQNKVANETGKHNLRVTMKYEHHMPSST